MTALPRPDERPESEDRLLHLLARVIREGTEVDRSIVRPMEGAA